MPAGRVAPRAGRTHPIRSKNRELFALTRHRLLRQPTPLEMTASPRAVEAMARVFRPGCTNLTLARSVQQSLHCEALNDGGLLLQPSNCAVSPTQSLSKLAMT